MKWHNVTKGNPCPICGKGDWCGFNEDETMCICMRSPNEYPSKNGGYIYIFENGAWISPYKRLSSFEGYKSTPIPPRPPRIGLKWARKRLSAKEVEDFIKKDAHISLDNDNFGVREICGEDGFTECYTAWGFGCYESKSHPGCVGIPMRNAQGESVGIRFRNATSKKKTSLLGGRDGLFYSWKLLTAQPQMLFICEGATDAIALASMGFDVVGRSSCATGRDAIRDLCKTIRPLILVFIADNDKAKEINGSYREAGREGAKRLAEELKIPHKFVTPPTKDIRELILSLRKNNTPWTRIRAKIQQLVKDNPILFEDEK